MVAVLDFVAEDQELVAAEAPDGVARPHQLGDAGRDLLEEAIPGVVPETVVDRLEAIEVEEHHGDGVVVPAGPRERHVEPVREQRAIRQSGERVVQRPVGQLELALLALDGVADRALKEVGVGGALDQEVLGPLVHRPDRQALVLLPAEHHDGNPRRGRQELPESFQRRRAGQREVQQHAVDLLLGEVVARRGKRPVRPHLEAAVAAVTQHLGDQEREVDAVLDHEHAQARKRHARATDLR